MTDTERIEAICKVANIKDIGDLSDGFHTFNGLYEQRMILFASLVKAYKDKAWKSYRHEDGEYCFGGGWFVVGIDTPKGSYTYHYENKYWDMFDCIDLPKAKHWDGHTEADAETRLMSLKPEEFEWCHDCKEYDQTQHCCHRWTKVIGETVKELKAQPERKKGEWLLNGGRPCECSVCHHEGNEYGDARFCAYCGARMKEVKNDMG